MTSPAPATPTPPLHSLADLTAENVRAVQRIEAEVHAQRSPWERIGEAVGEACGSGWFLALQVSWISAWIGYNLWPGVEAFDPYPFTFLTLMVSLEAIFLLTFILMSQRRSARVSERRDQLALQINLLAEQEATMVLTMLDRIAVAVGVGRNDPGLHAMKQETPTQAVADQIARAKGDAAAKR
jgi:uncharacterized membrane protein